MQQGMKRSFGTIWGAVVTRQKVRSSFFNNMERSCHAAGMRNSVWNNLGWSCDATAGEKEFLIGFRMNLRRSKG